MGLRAAAIHPADAIRCGGKAAGFAKSDVVKYNSATGSARRRTQDVVMINPYRILNGNLPERLPPSRTAVSAEPKQLQAWVEALPRANQQVFLGDLQRILMEFRARRFEGFARLEAMEVLRPMLLEAAALLASRLQGSTFPLTGMKAESAKRFLELNRELALAYRMAVAEACAPAGKVPLLRSGRVALALIRAVYHHARWLAASYFVYRAPEPDAWAQLYALAAFAMAHKLESKAIEDPVERRSLTVALLQNQAILLSLANPYRFSQRELADLWTLTRDTASLIELTPQRFSAAGALALIDRDAAPVFVSRAPDPGDGDVYWADLRKLNDLIRAAVSHAGAARGAVLRLSREYHLPMPVDLLARALEGWSQDAARGFARLDGGYVLDSVLGLTAVHFQLAGRRDLDGMQREVRSASSGVFQSGSRERAGAEAAHGETVEVQVQDQSLGGYRLRWEAEHGVRVRIGELVGVALPIEIEARDWAVGTVRWLRFDEDGAVEAGVDLVARRSQAVALRGVDASGGSQTSTRALALAGVLEPPADGADELFLIDGLTGLETPQVEVVRMGDRWDGEHGVGLQTHNRPALRQRRRAGDYLVVAPVNT